LRLQKGEGVGALESDDVVFGRNVVHNEKDTSDTGPIYALFWRDCVLYKHRARKE
jgi:hypothetical protein